MIKRIGTGTEDIIKEYKDLNLPISEFRQEFDFCVTIWRKKSDEDTNEKNNFVNSDVKDCPNVVKKLTNRQRTLLLQLKLFPSINAIELAQKTNTTSRIVQRDPSEMQKLGFIAREGGRKEGRWIVLS